MQTFLKQYGERRTGTNYLRWFVQANLANVSVLMHVLGDKHGPPAPLETIWRDAQSAADPKYDFVYRATYKEHARRDHAPNDSDYENVRQLARPVAEAYTRGAFGYLVAIKDPYAWAVSMARYCRWTENDHSQALAEACRAFNERYASWLALPDPMVVRHETVLHEPEATIERIAARFRLRRTGHRLRGAERRMKAMVYDHEPIGAVDQRFDPFYTIERRYLDDLRPEHRDIVTRLIDWDLFAPLGYVPIQEHRSVG